MENVGNANPSKKKKIIIGVVVSLLVILIGGAIFYSAKGGKFVAKKAMGANLSLTEGTIMIQKAGSDRFEEAKQGDSVYTEYTIKSLENSKAVIVFDTGDVIRLSSNTEVKIQSITGDLISVEDLNGELYSRVEPSKTKKFEIVTEGYPATAMGTAYSTKYNKNDKQVEYKVTESKIKVGKNSDLKEVDTAKKAKLKTDSGVVEINDMNMDDLNESFMAWNKEKDESSGKTYQAYNIVKEKTQAQVETKTENQAETQPQVTTEPKEKYFKLSGSATGEGALLKWSVTGYDIPSGFKVLKDNSSTTPVYPGSNYVYLSSSSTRSYEWKISDGETYNFRVCAYDGNGKCLSYSNTIKITVPKIEEKKEDTSTGVVNSISLSGSKPATGKAALNWSVDGTSSKGFKVVWSKNPSPVYPSRSGDSYHYYTDPTKSSDIITGLESGQTYYFRVCEYLGGSCGKYSNEVTLVID